MALTYYSKTVEAVGEQTHYLDFIADFDFVLLRPLYISIHSVCCCTPMCVVRSVWCV